MFRFYRKAEQTEAAYRPYITISHHLTSGGTRQLIVKNTGRTNAENLKLEVSRDFPQYGGESYRLASLPAFNDVTQSFPPGSELVFMLAPEKVDELDGGDELQDIPVFEITATYSYPGKTVRESTAIDLNLYDKTFIRPNPTEKQLKEMNKVLGKMLAEMKRWAAVKGEDVIPSLEKLK